MVVQPFFDLVGNPEDRFSHNGAHIKVTPNLHLTYIYTVEMDEIWGWYKIKRDYFRYFSIKSCVVHIDYGLLESPHQGDSRNTTYNFMDKWQ